MVKNNEFPDIDECLLANPCGNGAQCINTDGSYKCLCTPGWTGINCTDGESIPILCNWDWYNVIQNTRIYIYKMLQLLSAASNKFIFHLRRDDL